MMYHFSGGLSRRAAHALKLSLTRYSRSPQVFPAFSTAPAPTGRAGAVFDIDGVLCRGKNAIRGARESLVRLNDAHIPFVCLTNGMIYELRPVSYMMVSHDNGV